MVKHVAKHTEIPALMQLTVSWGETGNMIDAVCVTAIRLKEMNMEEIC